MAVYCRQLCRISFFPLVFLAGLALARFYDDANSRQNLLDTSDQVISQNIQLPEIQEMFTKYGFAKLWNLRVGHEQGRLCNKSMIGNIRLCGIEKMWGYIIDRSGVKERKEINSDYFSNICSQYDNFKRCVQGFNADDCFEIGKFWLDTLYQYLCNNSVRALLEKQNTAGCLLTLQRSSLVNTARSQAGCENSFSDMTTTFMVMFSMYHDHGVSNITEEIPGLKEYLRKLCLVWQKMEKCTIPAYVHYCGVSAGQFYLGLINKMEKDLAKQFSSLGVEELALCDKTTGTGKLEESLESGQSGLVAYVRRQWEMFARSATAVRHRNPCSVQTTTAQFNICFWKALTVLKADELEKLGDPRYWMQSVRVLNVFGNCYNKAVNPCPPNAKIDVTDFLTNFRDLMNHAGDIMMCPEVISMAELSLADCGVSLGDIGNQFILKGSLQYLTAMQGCMTNIPTPTVPSMSCVLHTFNESVTLRHEGSCVTELRPYLSNVIRSLEDVMNQVPKVYGLLHDVQCKGTLGD